MLYPVMDVSVHGLGHSKFRRSMLKMSSKTHIVSRLAVRLHNVLSATVHTLKGLLKRRAEWSIILYMYFHPFNRRHRFRIKRLSTNYPKICKMVRFWHITYLSFWKSNCEATFHLTGEAGSNLAYFWKHFFSAANFLHVYLNAFDLSFFYLSTCHWMSLRLQFSFSLRVFLQKWITWCIALSAENHLTRAHYFGFFPPAQLIK